MKRSTYLRLLRCIRPYWVSYALALLGVGATSLVEVGKASFFKYILDGMSRESWQLIHTALWLGITLFIIETITNFSKAYLVETSSAKVVIDLRTAMFKKVQRLPLSYFERNHSGDIMSRFTNDLMSAQNAVGWQFIHLIENPLSALVAFIYLASLDLKLALFCLFVGPTTVIAGKLFGGTLRRNAVKTQEKISDIMTLLSDVLSTIPVVKSFQMENRLTSRFVVSLKELFSLGRRSILVNASLNGTANGLAFVSIFLTFTIASYKVMHHEMSIGTVLAFTQLMNRLTWPFSGLASLWGSLQAAMAAADRVFDILDEPDEHESMGDTSMEGTSHISVKSEPMAVEFRGVSFGYDELNPVLVDISLSIPQGETLALVGPSGSGKSSLLKLLLGFYQPNQGSIHIDGTDTRALGLERLRAHSSFVPQETVLISGTIGENIRCGNPNASDEDMIKAAKAANAHEFIIELSGGYGAVVGERGAKLSGGQRQRIAIARALLKNPAILLLDEATSALDSESEFLVQEALAELMKGRTCIVVAHRLSTIRNAHHIAVLDGGKVVEYGSHQELINFNGLYANMYNRQFGENGDEVA